MNSAFQHAIIRKAYNEAKSNPDESNCRFINEVFHAHHFPHSEGFAIRSEVKFRSSEQQQDEGYNYFKIDHAVENEISLHMIIETKGEKDQSLNQEIADDAYVLQVAEAALAESKNRNLPFIWAARWVGTQVKYLQIHRDMHEEEASEWMECKLEEWEITEYLSRTKQAPPAGNARL